VRLVSYAVAGSWRAGVVIGDALVDAASAAAAQATLKDRRGKEPATVEVGAR